MHTKCTYIWRNINMKRHARSDIHTIGHTYERKPFIYPKNYPAVGS